MERLTRKGASRPCQSNTATAASKKEIDERRLRKLKVYLRSVSYNSCEGLPTFPTLPDLYEDTILSEEFPCDTMKLSSRHHCAPTPFLIACCFNRRYPVNARKRAGNMRSRPSIKQSSEKMNRTTGEKKTLPIPGNTVSSTSNTTSNEKVNMSVVTGKLGADSTMEREIAKKCGCAKIVDQEKCAGNEKNNDRESPKDCNSTSIVKITTENKDSETAKCNNEISHLTVKGGLSGGKTKKGESCCEIKKNIWEDEDVRSESKTSEVSGLKTTVEKIERMGGRKEDALAKNKHDNRNETQKQFEVSDDVGNDSRPINKGSNDSICSGINDNSSCHTSCEKRTPDDSTFEDQEIEDKTGKNSQTATVTSQKANIKPEVDETSVKSTERRSPPLSQKDEDDIISDISVDSSRRISPRLATLCTRHKTQPQDKERNVQRRDAKLKEKMKLKVSENANTRLRSRAVIKQPGHENRYMKGHQNRGK